MKKLILLLFAFILLFSCQKETLKNNSDYTRFVGVWVDNHSTEKFTIIFHENGKIEIFNNIERRFSYFPNKINKSHTVNNPYGLNWEQFSLDYYKKSEKIIDGRPITINISNDSLYYGYKNIDNFIADSVHSTLLIKQ
jgi:hypothetical protein